MVRVPLIVTALNSPLYWILIFWPFLPYGSLCPPCAEKPELLRFSVAVSGGICILQVDPVVSLDINVKMVVYKVILSDPLHKMDANHARGFWALHLQIELSGCSIIWSGLRQVRTYREIQPKMLVAVTILR
jgi:hypothetical protein